MFDFAALPDDPESEDDELEEVRFYYNPPLIFYLLTSVLF